MAFLFVVVAISLHNCLLWPFQQRSSHVVIFCVVKQDLLWLLKMANWQSKVIIIANLF